MVYERIQELFEDNHRPEHIIEQLALLVSEKLDEVDEIIEELKGRIEAYE